MKARSPAGRRLGWGLLCLVLAGALVAGSRGRAGPLTDAQRVERITSDVRCPTCQGLSAAVSQAPAARAIRDEVSRRVGEGQSEEQIKGFLVASYGPGVLLEPDSSGVGLLAWVLPVLAVLAAVVGLALAFRRWGRRGGPATAADRALVEEAMGG